MNCPNCDGEMTAWPIRGDNPSLDRTLYTCTHCDYTETR